ncbi:MAG: Uma2 family endonuclease [Chloroflexota bacterium]|nr:Uma2 family endonuclease [Chloroflexota bacterium]
MLTVVRSDVDAVVATHVTADELAALEGDGYRYDLLRGELIRVSPAGFEHGRIAARIAARLVVFLESHPELGVAVGAETGFRLARNPDTVLGPDAAVVGHDRLPPSANRSGYLELAPDLAVEIVSPSDRWTTVTDKVDAYLAAGVRLVWVVEPSRRTVRIYASDHAERRLRADSDAVLEGDSVVPGFSLSLADLFDLS